MNPTPTKDRAKSNTQKGPTHPSGIKPTEDDASARMTSEGDAQNLDPDPIKPEPKKDDSSDAERAKHSKRADAGAADAQEG